MPEESIALPKMHKNNPSEKIPQKKCLLQVKIRRRLRRRRQHLGGPGARQRLVHRSRTQPRFTANVTNLSCFQISFLLGPKLVSGQTPKNLFLCSFLVSKKPAATLHLVPFNKELSDGCDVSKLRFCISSDELMKQNHQRWGYSTVERFAKKLNKDKEKNKETTIF